SVTARSVSMSVIAPLTSPSDARNSSPAWAITSTSELPTPTTSNRAGWWPPAPRTSGAAGGTTCLTLPWPHAHRGHGGPHLPPAGPGRQARQPHRPGRSLGGAVVVPQGGDAWLNEAGTGLP